MLLGIDKNWKQDLGWGVLAGLVFIIVNKISANFSLGLPQAPMSANSVGMFLLVVFAAPVLEEAMFRGVFMWLLQELGSKTKFRLLKNIFVIILMVAVMFAAFHYMAYGAGYQTAFVGAFVFGILAGLLAYQTKSLLPPIAMHMMFNGYLYLAQVVQIGGL